MEKENFEKIVINILETVPENFKVSLENIDIIIDEDTIAPVSSGEGKNRKGAITLALYHGVPLTKRAGKSPFFPDKITIFKKAIESISKNPADIEKKVTKKTKAIMPVHLYGQVADMGKVLSFSKRHKLLVIEDACQAHGAKFKRKRVPNFKNNVCQSFNNR